MSDNNQATGSEEASSSLAVVPLQAEGDAILSVSQFPPLSTFQKSIEYPAVIIPVRRTAELRKSLSSVLLRLPKIKNVYPNPDDETTRKLVLDNPKALKDDRVRALLANDKCAQTTHTITFSYEDCTVDEVLRKLLPSRIPEVPSAFEVVGSIAHLNLRDDLLPYKFIVGKVILDKNQPRIQTVVNKLGSISNEYRTFGMEVIAGRGGSGENNDNGDHADDWSLVKVKEDGCEFTLDFQQVYWNSRLGGEHKRLVQMIRKDAQQRPDKSVVVADLMAGVGPFAVPLTAGLPNNKNNQRKKKKSNKAQKSDKGDNGNKQDTDATTIIVHANDLNPASYKYLKINAQNNKCPSDRLHCYNMDARAFCHQLQQQTSSSSPSATTEPQSATTSDDKHVEFHHVIMNLPASAPEFLDAFRGFTNTILPRIHVHCFAPKKPETAEGSAASKEEDGVDRAVVERCSNALGCALDVEKHEVSVRIVRDVSPRKNMVCVSFTLPEEVRGLSRIETGRESKSGSKDGVDQEEAGEPKTKRAKTTDD
ncbi:methyltransferase [Seminavis robusta]|uniref:tRNA (guanine(37)-N1)-methyltransferase n=1 Tax=Seminavis robusta TaxID=568900 RepID=A0A9N8DAU8_9STRA|nr:methyltransferase [Seminavis robusta]|eukprot:Sro19_g013350.1 methyltransferase (536) ;mRNA; f:44877-46484